MWHYLLSPMDIIKNVHGISCCTTWLRQCPTSGPGGAFKKTAKNLAHVLQRIRIIFPSSFETMNFMTEYIIYLVGNNMGMKLLKNHSNSTPGNGLRASWIFIGNKWKRFTQRDQNQSYNVPIHHDYMISCTSFPNGPKFFSLLKWANF